MPNWLTDLLAWFVGGAIAAVIMARLFRRGEKKRHEEFEAGRIVKVPASLRGT